jgi:hypothetical protein
MSKTNVAKAEAVPVDPLSAIIEAAVDRAIERRWESLLEVVASKPQKRLVDAGELAVALDLSVPSISKLVRDGLPHVMAGACRRFDVDVVMSWLAARTEAQHEKPE